MYTIYKHTLTLKCEHFGWSYIGQTSKSVVERWKNGSGYPKCSQPIFYNAIKKYGWDNFAHEILEVVDTLEEANERERYWIAYYHTWVYDDKCAGYNNTQGEEGNLGHFPTQETRRKLSLSHLGKGHKISEEQKLAISKANRGRSPSLETRRKLSLANKGKIKSQSSIEKQRNKMFKKVKCVETDQIYNSMIDAAQAIGCTPAAISGCVRGCRSSVFGYHFIYWKDELNENNNI